MKTRTTWIVIADGMKARVFSTTGKSGKLTDVPGGTREALNVPGHELKSDRPGRTFDSGGQGRHAMENPTPPREVEKHRFLHDLVNWLGDPRHADKFDDLAVVAPPRVIGQLRELMPDGLAARVTAELQKDLVNAPVNDLEAALHDAGIPS